jgi:flagellar biosynthesis/type III secretory pathway protein FliH
MTAIFNKARELAESLKSNVSAEIAEYGPRLHAAVDDAEHKLELWRADMEHWIELHFQPAAEAVKDESRKAYEAALRFVHDLHAEASTKTN